MDELQLSEDFNQSISSHLAEFTRRISSILILTSILTAIWSLSINQILHWLLINLDPCAENCINIFSPEEWAATRWLSASLLGLLTAAPFAMMQFYAFAKPGLLPSERRVFVSWMISIWLLGMAALWLTLAELLPWAYSQGHALNTSIGLTGRYDAAQFVRIAISIAWAIVLVLSAVSITILAGLSGLIFKKNCNWWRIRIYGIMLMLLWLITPGGYPGLIICLTLFATSIVEIVGWKFFRGPTPSGYGLETLLDAEGKEWRVLYADCNCCGTSDSITALKGMGVIEFDSLCRDPKMQDMLLDNAVRFDVNKVVFSGCLINSLPAGFIDSLRFLGISFHTLDIAHLSTMRTIGKPVEYELAMAKLTEPWSHNKSNQRVIEILQLSEINTVHYGEMIPFGLQLMQTESWITKPDDSLLTEISNININLIRHHD